LELPRETRVFVQLSSTQWRVGRVLGSLRHSDGSFEYDVKFPNDQRADIPETLLHVRCLDTFADPAGILAAGCAETQFFADRRRKALDRLRALRAASRGLTALTSSAVEVVPHQAAAAQRVLQDAVQRYLLADEVGLGKTIEAGVIIRQILIDDPRRTVLLLVPGPLVEQWREELGRRFGISEFADAVCIASHEELNESSSVLQEPDLLVVDEAHNIVPAAGVVGKALGARRLHELARRSDKVLLLSATPPVGDEDRLLGLLNLLDPASHPLGDREGFRRKIKERQAIGRMLLPLHKRSPPVVLRAQAQQAARMFPDDPAVICEVTRILAAGTDREALDTAVEALRDHVIRTYRLHDRLIRTRRTDASLWFRPRGPEWPRLDHVRLEFASEADSQGVGTLLEGWRIGAMSNANDDDRPALVNRYSELVSAAWCGPRALLRAVGQAAPMFAEEDEHLAALADWARRSMEGSAREDAVVTVLQDLRRAVASQSAGNHPKLVCFASDPDEALQLCQHLRRRLGTIEVASVLQSASAANAAAAVGAFRSDAQAWVLVTDRTGEEGLNLQFAHGMVHADLPFSAGRVEQRIGRLDRFGRRSGAVLHRVVLPDDDEEAPWRGWFDLLANGFKVFSRSISDVQFRLEALDATVASLLFSDGPLAVAEFWAVVEAELSQERTKLDEQHALDNMALLADDASPLVEAIDTSEENEQAIADDLRPWLVDVLRLRQEPAHADANDTLRLFWERETLLPDIPWRGELEPALDRPCTWFRMRAQSAASPPASLLRPGARLFEVLERIARWDDRGIAYATWRVEPGWEGFALAFRLVWVVEPRIPAVVPVWARDAAANSLRRRAEALLPVITIEQFIDDSGMPVNDSRLLGILGRDYRDRPDDRGRGSARDINLGSRPNAMAQAIDPALFGDVVTRVRASGEARLRADEAFAARQADALERHRLEAFRARRSLERRSDLHRAELGRDLPGAAQELETLDLIEAAVRDPAIRLDEMGLLVVSGKAPTT
jgi:ATP-dependent helicase HepA